MGDSNSDLTDKPVNGKPPLPPQRSKNTAESCAVLTPLIDEMIPPRTKGVSDRQVIEGSPSRQLTPRPGGFIKKLVVAEDEDKCSSYENIDETVIKEPTSYLGPPSYPVNDIVDGEHHGWSPELRRVLSVVVSTVMLLAHGESPCPPENLQWTYDFLMNVKDESNQSPPNTRWLLDYIRKIKNQNNNH